MILALIMASIVIAPIAEAVLNMSSKTPIGSVLRTAEWAQMPQALRNRGQFSAGVESARVLGRIQSGLEEILSQSRNEFGVITDRSKLIADITRLAEQEGLTPSDPSLRGTIQDITSEARAELIYQTQIESAYGYANWKDGQDPDALDAFPAQELIRVRDSKKKRDWLRRWAEAARAVGDSAALQALPRMVALKNSAIWEKLSRFGNPWPPFDFNSGMGVEDVSRGEAEDLGVLARGAVVLPREEDFNRNLQATVTDLSPQLKQNLQSLFRDQVSIDGDTVQWKDNANAYAATSAADRERASRIFAGSQSDLRSVGLRDDGTQGVGELEAASLFQAEIPRWSAEISAVASGRKPVFHEDLSIFSPSDLARAARAIQEKLPQGVIARLENGHLYVYNPTTLERIASPGALWPQVKANAGNGLWLGYGTPSITAADGVRVAIVAPDGSVVAGFRAPRDTARLYAAARAKDFTDATGQPYQGRVET